MASSLKANVRIIRGQPRGEPQDTKKKYPSVQPDTSFDQ